MAFDEEKIIKILVEKHSVDPSSVVKCQHYLDPIYNYTTRVYDCNVGTLMFLTNKDDTQFVDTNILIPASDLVMKPKSKKRLVIRDLSGKEVAFIKTVDGEDAPELFYCILEQEGWIMEKVLKKLKLPKNLDNYLDHDTWRANRTSTRDENTTVKIIVAKAHKYNLTLE